MALDLISFHAYLENSYLEHQNLIERYGYSFVPLKTLYLGGGTPSLWGKEGKIFFENFLKKRNIKIANDCEFTIEVNPKAWTNESLELWMDLGANRFSLGVQSLNQEMIKNLDRVHAIEDVYLTLEYFSKRKLNFSVDFMLGLPFSEENQRNVIEELEKALEYNPSHFSVYILTVKDNYPFYKNLPSETWIEEEFLAVSNFLKSKGFEHYEVSNFAKKNLKSQHNLNYWKSKTVAAFGPSATGFLSEEKIRYKWKSNSASFETEELKSEQFKLEQVYMYLRTDEGLNIDLLGEKFVTVAAGWQDRDLAAISDNKLRLNSKGYLVLDSLVNELFSLNLL
jgi:oxygen-independent coproporphyrinogen-3 oxidase